MLMLTNIELLPPAELVSAWRSHRSAPRRRRATSFSLIFSMTRTWRLPQYGAGFLARSHKHPERVASLEDSLAERPEASPS